MKSAIPKILAELSGKLPPADKKLFLEESKKIFEESTWPSEKTLSTYDLKARLLVSGKRTLADYADSPGSFYLMRTSLTWRYRISYRAELLHYAKIISRADDEDTHEDLARAKQSLLAATRRFLFQINDLTETRRTDFLDEGPHRRFRRTKRYSLRFLVDGWLDTFWDAVLKTTPSPRLQDSALFADLVSVLSLAGPRPSELQRDIQRSDQNIIQRVTNDCSKIEPGDGVVVQYGDGCLTFTIAGSKIGTNKGQTWRQITVCVENQQAEYLRGRIESNGGAPIVVGLELFTRLTPWLRTLSNKCFPTLMRGQHVTCYTFRHLVASEMKYSEYKEETIAKVLGQQAPDTQQFYGKARLAKDGYCTIKSVATASPVRPIKPKNLHLLRYLTPISFDEKSRGTNRTATR